jgi:hypothetical protein
MDKDVERQLSEKFQRAPDGYWASGLRLHRAGAATRAKPLKKILQDASDSGCG